MSYTLIGIALLFAMTDWVSEAKGWRSITYIARPAVIVFLFAWLISMGGVSGSLAFFALGLIFSLSGDIFLMMHSDRLMLGLASFVIAQLTYTAGFNPTPPPVTLPLMAIVLLVGLVASRLFRRIAAGLTSTGRPNLKAPVLLYSVVISLMLISALATLTRPEWSAASALLAASGAILIFLSDTSLAWNKFVHPIKHGRVITLSTYHIGQVLLTIGAVLHYSV